MESLTIKTVFLRLNYEQVAQIVDGLEEGRKTVDDESLLRYDNHVLDIISQLNNQGIQVVYNEDDEEEWEQSEIQQVKAVLKELANDIEESVDNHINRQVLSMHIKELNRLLFGE